MDCEARRGAFHHPLMAFDSGGLPLVRLADIHVNFLRQINHPCALEVGSRISRLGNSSFVFEAALFAPGENEPRSTAVATCVWFDYRENRSMPIPSAARDTIKKFEGLTE